MSRLQFNLSTILLSVACLAVGMAAGIDARPQDPDLSFLPATSPWNALWPVGYCTLAAAMVIGLLQQTRDLQRANQLQANHAAYSRFDFACSVAWRMTIALVLAAALLASIAVNRDRLVLPENEVFSGLLSGIWLQNLILFCEFLILRSELWFPPTTQNLSPPSNWWATLAFVVVAGVVAALAMADQAFIHYLVYIAISGIEAVHPPQFRRPGAYDLPAAASFELFWTAMAGLALFLFGAWLLLGSLRDRRRSASFRGAMGTLGLAVIGLSARTSWQLWGQLEVLGPDFAEGGIQSSFQHWIEAGLIVALAIPAGAICLTPAKIVRVGKEVANTRRHYLHWHLFFAGLALVSGVGSSFLRLARAVNDDWLGPFSWDLDYLRRIVEMLVSTSDLLPLCTWWMILLLAWRRVRHAPGISPLSVYSTDWPEFALSCLVVITVTVFGVASLTVFGLAFWLGPYWP